jgi:hypothetical protein
MGAKEGCSVALPHYGTVGLVGREENEPRMPLRSRPFADKRLTFFSLADGNIVRQHVAGTGKYEGLTTSGTVQPRSYAPCGPVPMRNMPSASPSVLFPIVSSIRSTVGGMSVAVRISRNARSARKSL